MANAVVDAPVEDGQVTEGSKVKRNPGIMVAMPPELKGIIDTEAGTAGTSSADIVRKLVAQHYGYELPEFKRGGGGGGRRKYASDEERKAAQKSKRNAQAKAVEMLIALAKDGKISLDPELASKLGVPTS